MLCSEAQASQEPAFMKLHKASTRYCNGRRTARFPVMLYRDGSSESVKLTPAFGGLLAVDRTDHIHVFHIGKWGSDAGFPKLRWVDHL